MKRKYDKQMEELFRDSFDGSQIALYDDTMDTKSLCSLAFREYREQGVDHPDNVKRFPNDTARLADWLRGLPAPFTPPYENIEIEKIGIAWGMIPDDADDTQILGLTSIWWTLWAQWMIDKVRG